MAGETIGAPTTTPAAGGSAAPAAVAPVPGSPAGLQGEELKQVTDAFGDLAEGPATAVPTAPAAGDVPPSLTGKPAATPTTTEPDPAAALPAVDAELPENLPVLFDKELEGMEPLVGTKPAPGADPNVQPTPDLSTPDAIARACNPDGKADINTQLKNAQTLLGKHSQHVHAARQIAEQFQPFTILDPQTGQFKGIDWAKIAETTGWDQVNEALASTGRKIVPVTDLSPPAGDAEFPADLVNEIVPGDEMQLDEKIELIKSDASKLVDLKFKQEFRARQQQQQAQQRQAQEGAAMQTTLEKLRTTDKGFAALTPAMAEINKLLPPNIGGALRANICYRLAKLDALLSPATRKAQTAAIYKQAQQDLLQKYGLALPGGGGGVHVAGRPGAVEGDEPLPDAQRAFMT